MAERPTATYDERLWLPWWAWPAGLAAATVLAAELTMGAPTLRHPVLYVGALALAALGMLALCRIRIRVAGADLYVDDARLPVQFVASVSPLDPNTRRDLLGPAADPLAFVVQRPWVRGSVRIDLDDPADPTPYWLVSTRRPATLAAALLAAREACAQSPEITSG